MRKLGLSVEEFFAADGPLSGRVKGYHPRQSQIAMAQAVFDAATNGQPIVAEAPTGVGKSFAYLVGGLLAGAKIVVVTANKSLQSQLHEQDLPMLAEIAEEHGDKLTFQLTLGKANYACRQRVIGGEGEGWTSIPPSPNLVEWIMKDTENGAAATSQIQLDAPHDPDWQEWGQVNVDDTCMGHNCTVKNTCQYWQSKMVASDMDVVIGNQHLLAIDTILGFLGIMVPNGCNRDRDGKLVPVVIVVDEAHEWHKILADMSGTELRMSRFWQYPDDIKAAARSLFTELSAVFAPAGEADISEYAQVIVNDDKDFATGLTVCKRLDNYAEDVWPSGLASPKSPADMRLRRKADKARSLADDVRMMIHKTPDKCVRMLSWGRLQSQKSEDKPLSDRIDFKLVRYDVSDISRTLANLSVMPGDPEPTITKPFLGQVPVFTSATLRAGGNFNMFLYESGMTDVAKSIEFDHVFDYKRQSRLFIPKTMDENPHSHRFQVQAANAAWKLAQLTEGRMFVLATAYSKLRKIGDTLEELAEGTNYTILRQDTMGRRIMDEFKQREGHLCILCGVSSFWQGVDVPGKTLSQVVICGLPFPVPSDPIFNKRCQAYDIRAGRQGASFMGLSIPEMSQILKQGMGRLIRRVDDIGVVTILDRRIVEKQWSRVVRSDLPPMEITSNFHNIESFLGYEVVDLDGMV